MNGYLQCLIDQYAAKVTATSKEADSVIYADILVELKKFQRYIQESQKPVDNNTSKKHIVFGFVGVMPDFMEYLKELNSKGKTVEEFLEEFMKGGQ